VAPDLREAPVALDEDGLAGVVATTDWLDLARAGVAEHDRSFAGAGHILTLFDHEGRMLTAEGDAAALEGLAAINFRPGGLWSEEAVGTNGPGTALATGAATHIVGAEHFCSRWQPWHCAAVPLRELSTGQILGVLDVSGFREQAHPHTLNLALALALAIEQSLAAREVERRYLAVLRLNQLAHRYPADTAVAVDRHGRVLLTSPSAPPELAPERDHPGLQSLVRDLVRRTRDSLPREVEVAVAANDSRPGVWHPVFDGRSVVGGCLVLESRTAVRGRRGTEGAPRLSRPRHTFADIVALSPASRAARDIALAAAETELPVLLLGERGTGKEVFAQAIHQAGSRRDRPFVGVHCASLSRDAASRIEAAAGGTLFLDEIGELPAGAQAVLLGLLEEGGIVREGEQEFRPVDVRVMAASRRDPLALVEQGGLRAELYHRINVIGIEVPPLRARSEDLTPMARRLFLSVARDLGRPELVAEEEVFAALQAYDWPGNIRELKNVIRRLMVLAGRVVTVADLPHAVRDAYLGRAPAPAAPPVSPIDREDARLVDTVNRARTMAEAAAELGITRSTLYRRMERFGLRPKRVVDRG
jgi:transcriptional regulator of acetoin/glycerol metabolism